MSAILDLISSVIEGVTGAQQTDADWRAHGGVLQEIGARLVNAPPSHWVNERPDMITRLEAALAALKHHDPSRDIRRHLAQTLEQIGNRMHGFSEQPAFEPVVPELRLRLQSWQEIARSSSAEEMERIDGRLHKVLEALEPAAQALTRAHAARVNVRLRYEQARAAADASPQLALRQAAHQLRESDAAAEGQLLSAQAAFLDVIPLAAGLGHIAAAAPGPLALPAPEAHAGRGHAPALTAVPVSTGAARWAEPAPALPPPPPPRPVPAWRSPEPAARVVAEVPVPHSGAHGGPPHGEAAGFTARTASPAPPEGSPEALAGQVWQALQRNHAAAAYQLARLAEAEGVHLPGVPPAVLLKAAALANELLRPDGEIAAEVTASLAALDLHAITGPAPAVAAAHLLLAAALLRPLLLAPDSRAAQLAGQLQLPEGCAQLHILLPAFAGATAALRQHRLGARALAVLRDESSWRGELLLLTERVRDWRSRAASLQLRGGAAAALWQEWQQPHGEIDRLLAPLQTHAAGAQEEVRAQLTRLGTGLEKAIEDADRRSKRRGEPIRGAALTQLRARVEEARQLALAWLALMDARPARDSARTLDLERAYAVLGEHRLQTGRELEALQRHPDHRIAAAAALAARSLEQLWALFDPQARLPALEAGPQLLLNRPLLELPECTLRPDWSIRGPVRPVRTALAARLDAAPPLLTSFETRLAQHDLQGAARLATLASREDAAAAQMHARLDAAAGEHWAQVRAQLAQLSESIESLIVYGLVSGTEREACTARLAHVEERLGDLAQTEAIEEDITQIRAELAALSKKRQEEIQEHLRAVRSSANPEDLSIIDRALHAGDLASASESLMRIWDGQRLHEESAARDPFEELYGGTLARDIETFLAGHAHRPEEAVHHIERGGAVGTLGFAALPEAQRREAGRLLHLWLDLRRAAGDHRVTPLAALLTGLGFGNVRVLQGMPVAGDVLEAELQCEPVADRAICPVPQLGSAAQGRYRLLCVSEHTDLAQLLAHLGAGASSRPAIVLHLGRLTGEQRHALAVEARSRRRAFVVIDEVLLTFLAAERGSRLPALFACALPFAGVDPYVTTPGAVPPELFFGRRNELDRVLDPAGPCLVYGGHLAGKTALLRQAERSFDAPAQQRHAVWIDLKSAGIGWTAGTDSSHLWRVLWRRLLELGLLPHSVAEPDPAVNGRVEQLLHALERWFAGHPQARVLLLLDEADRFLEDDARNHGCRIAGQLKLLMDASGHRFKVVLAGLHSVARAAELPAHPLGHVGGAIEIGPLIKRSEWREARQLVRGPLLAAGYKLEHAGMADRILAQASFHPSLIQLYCSRLVERALDEARLGGGPRFLIKESRLGEIFLARELREEIRQRFRATLQLDPRYAVVAYAIAHRSYEQGTRAGSFTAAEVAQMSRNWWWEGFAHLTADELRILLDEMVGLGVLRRTGDSGPYTLRSADLPLLVGTEAQVYEELLRPRELPEAFAPQDLHPAVPGSGSHPLTLSQIGFLAGPRTGVAILAGSRAGGIDRVAEALRHEHGDAHFEALGRVTDAGALTLELRRRIEAPAPDSTHLLLVSPDSPWDSSWVQTALAEIRKMTGKNHRVKVVFIADAAAGGTAALLPGLAALEGVEVITLRPWSESFVRHWLRERHQADGPAELEALRARTGFWPLLLEHAHGTGQPVNLETFVGRQVRLGQLLVVLARWGGDGEL